MSLIPVTSSNPFVQEAFNAEQTFREHTIKEIQSLKTYIDSLHKHCDFDKVKEALFKRVQQDQDYFDWFGREVNSYGLGHKISENQIPYSIKTLHMRDILKRTKDLLDSDLGLLFYHQDPHGYRVGRAEPTILGDQSSIWGNSKGTTLKTALIEIALTMRDVQKGFLPSKVADLECIALDKSYIAHQTLIPRGLYHHESSFTGQHETGYTLTFTHSGYAFGGHRGESLYPNGKEGGPEDCSSFIAKLIGSKYAFNTSDQLRLYQQAFEPQIQLPQSWTDSSISKEMATHLKPIQIRDPQKDIREGQVFAYRNFPNDRRSIESSSGHTGLVLGFNSNARESKVDIINYNRSEPQIEGFGLSSHSYQTTPTYKVMFFDVNQC